jgi:hypothetical protein
MSVKNTPICGKNKCGVVILDKGKEKLGIVARYSDTAVWC